MEIIAPAKINLGLWVGERQRDGYHLIDTIFHSVDWGDRLHIEPDDQEVFTCSVKDLSWEPSNLVYRAYYRLKTAFPAIPTLRIHLDKELPIGSGLGGGSSDAAALLRWGRLWNRKVVTFDWIEQAAFSLGKDVSFLLTGGAARAQGLGDRLIPMAPWQAYPVVLLNPGFSLSTQAVYQAYDELDACLLMPNNMDHVSTAMDQAPGIGMFPNSLEAAAFVVEPRLRDFHDLIQQVAKPFRCSLSGSGPTYYVIGEEDAWAEWLVRRMRDKGVPVAVHSHLQGTY